MSARAPSLFVCHGGGPLPVLGDKSHSSLIEFFTTKAQQIFTPKPKAIVMVTAHWEESQPFISSGAKHDLLYDYYGFPSESYKIQYKASGSPQVAQQVADLLRKAGFSPEMDSKRGWDHGTFIPLKMMLPEADIPIVQVSVLSSQDAAAHYKMGRALESLRDEGVAIVGSGMIPHNFSYIRKFMAGGSSKPWGVAFDAALTEACAIEDVEEREAKLLQWKTMPGREECQALGAAEHLMPLFVVAG
ncbi:predicted protein, partial [Naegleria gruberi]